MRYEINREINREINNEFKPFSIKFTIKTEEEFANFHDNIMGKITGEKVHAFHGDVYSAGAQGLDSASGEILPCIA